MGRHGQRDCISAIIHHWRTTWPVLAEILKLAMRQWITIGAGAALGGMIGAAIGDILGLAHVAQLITVGVGGGLGASFAAYFGAE